MSGIWTGLGAVAAIIWAGACAAAFDVPTVCTGRMDFANADGSTYNGRLYSAIVEQDQPIGMLWDAQVFDLDGWIIPEGLPEDRLARVKDFVKFATDTQRLADQAQYISYGPARASSAPLVPEDMKMHMPTDPANSGNTFLYNYEFWADYRDDIDAKFQAWLAQ